MRLAVFLMALGLAAPVAAQGDLVEFQVGGGPVWHYNTPGLLGSITGGAVFWPWERVGVAVRQVESLGDSFWDSPALLGDGQYFGGRGRLRFTSVTARFRWFVDHRDLGLWEINFGAGAMVYGHIDTIITEYDEMGAGRIAERLEERFPVFLAAELFAGRKVWRNLGFKGGVTYDAGAADTGISWQLVALLTAGL